MVNQQEAFFNTDNPDLIVKILLLMRPIKPVKEKKKNRGEFLVRGSM
jgi:hypothetical protein